MIYLPAIHRNVCKNLLLAINPELSNARISYLEMIDMKTSLDNLKPLAKPIFLESQLVKFFLGARDSVIKFWD